MDDSWKFLPVNGADGHARETPSSFFSLIPNFAESAFFRLR
jgi:hypothetical protein